MDMRIVYVCTAHDKYMHNAYARMTIIHRFTRTIRPTLPLHG